MANKNPSDMLNNMFNAYKSSYQFKDTQKMEVAARKTEFEEHLDEMWRIYHKNPAQIVEYNKQVNSIKESGCKVLRNSKGKHKIVIA